MKEDGEQEDFGNQMINGAEPDREKGRTPQDTRDRKTRDKSYCLQATPGSPGPGSQAAPGPGSQVALSGRKSVLNGWVEPALGT